jgi:hypothetical protein
MTCRFQLFFTDDSTFIRSIRYHGIKTEQTRWSSGIKCTTTLYIVKMIVVWFQNLV